MQEIDVVESSADSSTTELTIDIYKEAKGFKATANRDEDDEAEIEKYCATQDAIDDIVEEVNASIEFIQSK
jgi:hypothetical protein